jgi:hypothetical protein
MDGGRQAGNAAGRGRSAGLGRLCQAVVGYAKVSLGLKPRGRTQKNQQGGKVGRGGRTS